MYPVVDFFSLDNKCSETKEPININLISFSFSFWLLSLIGNFENNVLQQSIYEYQM